MSARITARKAPAIRSRRPRIDSDAIREFYRRFPAKPRSPAPKIEQPFTLTNFPNGIGDTLVLLDSLHEAHRTGKVVYAWSASPHWGELREFAAPEPAGHPACYVALAEAVAGWDLGAGHMTQRARRLLGLPVPACPSGWLSAPGVRRIANRVSLHFEAGAHADWQRAHLHPRARHVYPNTWKALREFIRSRPDLSFVEVGQRRYLQIDEVEDGTGRPLRETVRLMAECEFHLGLISGPMHLANALGSKVVAVLNFPRPCQLMLPNIKSIGMVEEEWLYPHQVCLHQEEDSAHWPLVSAKSLSEAIDGEVYPYWSTRTAEALIL